MTRCSVPGCSSQSHQGLGVFSLPRNAETRQVWLQFLQKCGKSVDPLRYFSICELHFDKRHIYRDFKRTTVKPGALPLFRINQERKLQWIKRRHKFIEFNFQEISSTFRDNENHQEYEDYEELQENCDYEQVPAQEDNVQVTVQEDNDQVRTKLWFMTWTD